MTLYIISMIIHTCIPEFIDPVLHNFSVSFNTVFDQQLTPPIKIVQLGFQLRQSLHHLLHNHIHTVNRAAAI